MSEQWETDMLLRELAQGHWTLYYFGERTQPDAICGVRSNVWFHDVVVLRGHDRAAAYRTPVIPEVDAFRATHVIWHYLGGAVHTLRAAMTLHTGYMALPLYVKPDECKVPESYRKPYSVRFATKK